MFRQSMELMKWRQHNHEINLIRRAHCYVQIVVQTCMWGWRVKRIWQHIVIQKPAKLDMRKTLQAMYQIIHEYILSTL